MRTVVVVRERQHVPLGPIDRLPIRESQILDLVRAFLSSDGAEQMPLAAVLHERRVLVGIEMVAVPVARTDQRPACRPPQLRRHCRVVCAGGGSTRGRDGGGKYQHSDVDWWSWHEVCV